MKKQILNSLTTAFILSLVVFMSCGGGDDDSAPATPNADQLALLTGNWEATSTLESNNIVDGWADGFILTLDGTANGDDIVSGRYSTNDARPADTQRVWASSGTWEFNSIGTRIEFTRDDEIVVTAVLGGNDNNELTLSFEILEDAGRTDIVNGNWTQIFRKQ